MKCRIGMGASLHIKTLSIRRYIFHKTRLSAQLSDVAHCRCAISGGGDPGLSLEPVEARLLRALGACGGPGDPSLHGKVKQQRPVFNLNFEGQDRAERCALCCVSSSRARYRWTKSLLLRTAGTLGPIW